MNFQLPATSSISSKLDSKDVNFQTQFIESSKHLYLMLTKNEKKKNEKSSDPVFRFTNFVEDSFKSCNGHGIRLAVLLFCFGKSNNHIKLLIVLGFLLKKIRSMRDLIVLYESKSVASQNINSFVKDVVDEKNAKEKAISEKYKKVLIEAFLEFSDCFKLESFSFLALSLERMVYIRLCKESTLCTSPVKYKNIAPYAALIDYFVKNFVIAPLQKRELEEMKNQMKLNKNEAVKQIISEIEEKTALIEKSVKTGDPSKTEPNEFVFDEEKDYEVFICKNNLLSSLTIKTIEIGYGIVAKVSLFLDRLFDVHSIDINNMQNNMADQTMVICSNIDKLHSNKLSWSERLNLVSDKTKIHLESVKGYDLNKIIDENCLIIFSYLDQNSETFVFQTKLVKKVNPKNSSNQKKRKRIVNGDSNATNKATREGNEEEEEEEEDDEQNRSKDGDDNDSNDSLISHKRKK